MFNGDTLLATVDQQTASGVATGTPKTRYIHPDHLGSTNVVTECSVWLEIDGIHPICFETCEKIERFWGGNFRPQG